MTTTGITPDAGWRNWGPTITTLRPATASTPKSEPGGEESFCTKANFEGIVGQSTPLQQVLRLVEMMANSDSTMLVLGETGTGKELIARAIHDRSRRKQRALVKQNCAAVPSGRLESELFGHEGGSLQAPSPVARQAGVRRPGHAVSGRDR